MSRLIIAVIACVVGAAFGPSAHSKDIDGQVFIVTKGAQAIKLPLVQVVAFRKADIETHIVDINSHLATERTKADAEVSEASQSLQRARRAVPNSDEALKRDKEAHGSYNDVNDAMRRGGAIGTRIGEARKKIPPIEARLREAAARQKFLYSAAPYFVALPEPLATAKTDADGRFKLGVPDGEDIAVLASSSRTVFDRVEKYFWIVRLAPNDTSLTLSNDNLTTSGSSDSLVATKE